MTAKYVIKPRAGKIGKQPYDGAVTDKFTEILNFYGVAYLLYGATSSPCIQGGWDNLPFTIVPLLFAICHSTIMRVMSQSNADRGYDKTALRVINDRITDILKQIGHNVGNSDVITIYDAMMRLFDLYGSDGKSKRDGIVNGGSTSVLLNPALSCRAFRLGGPDWCKKVLNELLPVMKVLSDVEYQVSEYRGSVDGASRSAIVLRPKAGKSDVDGLSPRILDLGVDFSFDDVSVGSRGRYLGYWPYTVTAAADQPKLIGDWAADILNCRPDDVEVNLGSLLRK